MNKSALFEPYRTVGIVTDSTPFCISRLGQESFVTVGIGKAWQIFNCEKLRLSLVAPQRESLVTALASYRNVTFSAAGQEILVWRRTHEVTRLKLPSGRASHLLMLGPVLLAVTDTNYIFVYDFSDMTSLFSEAEFAHATTGSVSSVASLEKDSIRPAMQIELTPPINDTNATVTAIVHPQTYVNKVVIAWSDGTLELWNFNTNKLVHRFKNLRKLISKEASATEFMAGAYDSDRQRRHRLGLLTPSSITALAKSPAVDVIAVGLASGEIVLFNLRFDEPIHVFTQADGPVHGLAFRTDDHPFLVSGSAAGHLTVWDLEAKRVHSVIRNAHSGPVTSIEFLLGEPILISSGTDNALRTWIFDQADKTGRLLRSKAGHYGSPTLLTYYSDDIILSAGLDQTLRSFHVNRDQQSCELSQGSLQRQAKAQAKSIESLRLPRITSVACNVAKERDWASIITTHVGNSAAVPWSMENKTVTEMRLVNKFGADAAAATASAVSACGNFAIIGYADGRIERFNVQSGMYRGRYGKGVQAEITRAKQMEKARRDAKIAAAKAKGGQTILSDEHALEVSGLFVDSLNSTLVSTSLDGSIKFWDFGDFSLKETVSLASPVGRAAYNADSDLMAAATDDFKVHVFDCEAHKVVRRFTVGGRLTSMTFSPDGRMLVCAQANGEMRVFDLPSGRLVDWFAFDKPVVSVAFSPKSDMIATAHVGSLAVFLWVNRAYFSTSYLGLSVPRAPIQMELKQSDVFAEDAEEHTTAVQVEAKRDTDLKDKAAAAATKAALGSKKQAKKKSRTGDTSSDESDGDDDVEEGKGKDGKEEEEEWDPVVFARKNPVDPDQLKSDVWGDLVTLSGLPSSKWVQLSMLEQIRQRNKPKEAVKAPAQAPFFLNMAAGVTAAVDASEFKKKYEEEKRSQDKAALSRIMMGQVQEDDMLVRLSVSIPSVARAFTRLAHRIDNEVANEENGLDEDDKAAIRAMEEEEEEGEEEEEEGEGEEDEDEDEDEEEDEEDEDGDDADEEGAIDEMTSFLMSLSPSNLDAEIRSLSLGAGERTDVPKLFAVMRYLVLAMNRRRHFEFVQAVAHLFLKTHMEAIGHHKELLRESVTMEQIQKRMWRHIETYFNSSLCMLSQFCNIIS